LLIKRPNILSNTILVILNQIYNTISTLSISLDLPFVNDMLTSLISKVTAVILANDKKVFARFWHKEIKYLFFKCKASLNGVIESLIKIIFNYDFYSNNTKKIIYYFK
jgi:hypothetical protein